MTDDACWFAIALLACWIAGIEPVVPGLAGPQIMTREKARYGTILARSQRKFRYGPGTLAIDELVRGSGRIPFHHLDEKLEYSVFTSGSTGEPKEIRRSLGDVCAEASAIISHFRYVFDQTDCFASTVPCRHSFGLMFRVLIPMFVGLPTCRQIFRSEENFLYKKYDSPSSSPRPRSSSASRTVQGDRGHPVSSPRAAAFRAMRLISGRSFSAAR